MSEDFKFDGRRLGPSIVLRAEDRHIGMWVVHVDPFTLDPMQFFPMHVLVILRESAAGKIEGVGRIRVQLDDRLGTDSLDKRVPFTIDLPSGLTDDAYVERIDHAMREKHPGCEIYYRPFSGTATPGDVFKALSSIPNGMTSLEHEPRREN